MPILDPSLQYYLCTHYAEVESSSKPENSTKDFFLRYLKIASTNIYRNTDTIMASIQFKNDLPTATIVINQIFGSNFTYENDFNNPTINNYYSYLYNRIKPDLTENIGKKQNGFYYIYKDIFQIKLFQPLTEFSNVHSWYFTDSPIAILCVDLTKSKVNINILSFINLEIDIIAGSGFTLVLCVIANLHSDIIDLFLDKTIKNHPFSEIHFNLIPDSNYSNEVYDFYSKVKTIVTDNNLYFYLYTTFSQLNDKKFSTKNIQKNTPFLTVFNFSDDMSEAFNQGTMSDKFRFCHRNSTNLYRYKSFPYCKIGFSHKKMRIIICNVLLYNTMNKTIDFIPSCPSGLTFAYVSRKDFLNTVNDRVSVFYDDTTKNHQLIEKFIDFDDLHLIRPDFYVKDTLYLTKTQKKTLKAVKSIQNTADQKYIDHQNEEFEKENIFAFLKASKIKKGLSYVAYAYQHYATYSNSYLNFHVHTNQIFTALEACKVCLLKKDQNHKGVVYQVETGEGKSCIIQLIAAVLAICGKTVHITSSNINLANRDYFESYNFFQTIGLETAVLLHYNELPYINFQNLPNDNNVYKKEFYPRKFFRRSLFKNSSNMNFSVCGINNDNELTKDKANIVFSTFINFESLYLRMMEMCPSYIEKYFRDCSLLIDEADSILIDELTNGTILSRPLKTNGREILIFVYLCNRDKKEPEFVFNEIKKRWPKCMDLSLDHVKEMYREIDIVNQPEFENGKKYSIEKFYVQEKKQNLVEKVANQIKLAKEKTFDKFKNAIKSKFKKKNKSKKEGEKENESNEKSIESTDSLGSVQFMKKNENSLQSQESIKILSSIPIVEPNHEEAESTESNQVQIDDSTHPNKSNQAIETVQSVNIEQTKESNLSLSSNKATESNLSLSSNEATESNISLSSNETNTSFSSFQSTESFLSTENEGELVKGLGREYKVIVPFDYDHKGILEPNKEFSGFIQQFIAIKEMLRDEENKNMMIKDVSMNYLYVSHPIFVKLYSGVCGLTGTIGNKHDKKILQTYYELSTRKIPRNAPNRRIELPIIHCKSITERNRKICEEVFEYHKKENPVLVIFQDLNEISDVLSLLKSKGIKNINIFNGKDEKVKPDKIAGLKGAVSLGTNVCGRGTDIKNPSKPLHVIVTYFTSNTRVMYQAFGRTARQGNDGTVRIICLKSQYLSPTEILNDYSMHQVLKDFDLKNRLQIQFIQYFKKKREWIFKSSIESQKLSHEQIEKMREAKININRIKVVNYEFPICMSIQTFLLIQSQKIFSLYNCPNCKYTWMLFQKYLREMILESWSLTIDQVDKEYKNDCPYFQFLEKKIEETKNYLSIYLTQNESLGKDQYEVIPTFMNIFSYIRSFYENIIMKSFSNNSFDSIGLIENKSFLSFSFGFKPYALVDKSGARINTLDNPDQEQEFIMDPELKYMRKQPKGFKPTILSITEKIDDIFNLICKKINEVIGSYTGLKFFLRRTLGGCEFGVCFDFELENKDDLLNKDFNCLVDIDPLFVFTISVKSMKVILAGILIMGLVYIAKIAKTMADWISNFPVKITSALVKQTVKVVLNELVATALSSQIEDFCGKICSFLIGVIRKQIDFLRDFRSGTANLFENILKIMTEKDFSEDAVFGFLCGKSLFRMKSNFSKLLNSKVDPIKHLLKIGFLLMMAFGTFMMSFHYRSHKIQYNTTKVAASYDQKQNTIDAMKENDKFVEEEKFEE